MVKNWVMQEYYNEYLDIKEKMLDVKTKLRYAECPSADADLTKLTERLRHILSELELGGIDMSDLVLLSAGVDISLFE